MEQEVQRLFRETDLTLSQIGEMVGASDKVVFTVVKRSFSNEERKARKIKNYRRSKLGTKNPMFGKQPSNHKGDCLDGKGYLTVVRPAWYTDRPDNARVFKHHVVICEALGLSTLPRGFVVHHIDGNPLNNSISNLALLTASAHTRLHARERATTIPKGSTSEANADGSAEQVDNT